MTECRRRELRDRDYRVPLDTVTSRPYSRREVLFPWSLREWMGNGTQDTWTPR